MKRFNTQTRFVPLKIDEDFNVGHIQSKDGKVKVHRFDEVWGNKVKVTFTKKNENERMAVEKYSKENHCKYCEEKYIFYK